MKKNVNLRNVKGSYDFSPDEQRVRNYIQDTLRDIFERYGYKPLETPILCFYDLLAGKYDESSDLLNEIYKLHDQGDRDLGLRYDLTVPFAKYISLTKDIRLPFKRYEIGKVFRDGPVKVGRDREFLQCDVDVVGLDGSLIEAELISLWLTGYRALGIDVYVKYNSRNLMRGLIKEVVDFEEAEIDRVVTVIDKMDKISREELLVELEEIGVSKEKGTKILKYFDLSLNDLLNKFSGSENEMITLGLEELSNLESILSKIGLSDDTVFTPSLARGQDYYTGNVFEVYSKDGELSCSLGGGGRYDKMITDFIDDGTVYPAVGVSFGLSTIYEILKSRKDNSKTSQIDIYIVPIDREVEALSLAISLRELGYNVEIDMTKRKIKRSFEHANKDGIPYVIVLGEDEIKNRTFKIKDMATSEETLIKIDELSKIVDIIGKK